MENKKVNWGILGTGQIALNRFMPALSQVDNSVLYGVAGRKKEKVENFIKDFPGVKGYLSYDEMLDDPNIDAVYVPLNNALHKEWTIKALNKKKHVLCEKPLACTKEEVDEMFKAAEDNNCYLMEAFAYLHSPYIAKIKEVIKSDAIGDLIHMNMWFSAPLLKNDPGNCRFWNEPGAGSMYDLGCYTLSLVRHLTDKEPIEIVSHGNTGDANVELTSNVLMLFDDKFYVSMFNSFETEYSCGFIIHGKKGIINGTKHNFNSCGDLTFDVISNDKTETVKVDGVKDNYVLEAEQFANVILGKEKPAISHDFSAKNVDLLDKIVKEAFKQGKR